MRRSITYGMLVLFLLFMITANPSGTGENGRNFLAWLGGGWDDAREFVGELIGDETADTNEFGEVPIATVEPAAPSAPEAESLPVPDAVDGGAEAPAVVE